MQVSANYSDLDFVVSDSYPELLKEIEEGLTDRDREKMAGLANLYLEPLAEYCGTPCRVLSGKRSLTLNMAIKGSKTSDHLFHGDSAACDITHDKIAAYQLWRHLQSGKPFGQLIYYPSRNFLHVSLPTSRHQGEIMVCDVRGKYYMVKDWPIK